VRRNPWNKAIPATKTRAALALANVGWGRLRPPTDATDDPQEGKIRNLRESTKRENKQFADFRLGNQLLQYRLGVGWSFLLESSPGGSPDVGDASDVLLSALAYQTYLGSALGYDEKLDAIARNRLGTPS
jgi:hypothetical protein